MHLTFHMLEHLKRAKPRPGQLSELEAENGEGRGEERPRKDGLLTGNQVPPMLQSAEIELHEPLADLELSRKKPSQGPGSISRDGPQKPQDADPAKMENPVKGSEPSQVANGTTSNRGCVEHGRKHSSADQMADDGGVEAPERADATVDEPESGKALSSNHRDVAPPSELGVNPNA